MEAPSHLAGQIKQAAYSLGFSAVGIANVPLPCVGDDATPPHTHSTTPLPFHLFQRLSEWLQRGYHGTMDWMARNPRRRSHPTEVLPGCRSIVCVGMNYGSNSIPDEGPGNGRIARYAWGKDYHEVLKERLENLETAIHQAAPEAKTRAYVDTGPVMEKAWAQEAGLGWIGKHSNLVSPKFGSWLFLGEVLTTLALPPDEPGADLCGSCSLCIQACPTQAIPEPYVVDANQCISYLTIEYRGKPNTLPAELMDKIGNRIFGCDDCLDVCPYNLYGEPSREPDFEPSSLTRSPNLESLAGITEKEFREQFHHSAIRRTKYQGFIRNVHMALAHETGPDHLTSNSRS